LPHAVVVKIGGSLLTRSDLSTSLPRWLAAHCPERQVNLLVGGGSVVDAFRHLDRVHTINPVSLHWMCVNSLRQTSQFVAALMGNVKVIETEAAFKDHCQQRPAGRYLIVPDTFYHPASGDDLPCDWTTTSDSMAALLAKKLGDSRLVLLKSCEITASLDLVSAARQGIVDPILPRFADELAIELATL